MEEAEIRERLHDLLFARNEQPIFLDFEAPLDWITEADSFISNASLSFGLTLGREVMNMTIPELIAHIKRQKGTGADL